MDTMKCQWCGQSFVSTFLFESCADCNRVLDMIHKHPNAVRSMIEAFFPEYEDRRMAMSPDDELFWPMFRELMKKIER